MIIEKDDPVFRRWVASQPCVTTGNTGSNHPHHCKLKSQGGKDPDNVISLQWDCHNRAHSYKLGIKAYFREKGIDIFKEAQRLSDEYRNIQPGDTCPFGKED